MGGRLIAKSGDAGPSPPPHVLYWSMKTNTNSWVKGIGFVVQRGGSEGGGGGLENVGKFGNGDGVSILPVVVF
jgi:hypothetical protein